MKICIISGCDRNDNAQYNLIKEWANFLSEQSQEVTVLFDKEFQIVGLKKEVRTFSFPVKQDSKVRLRGGFSLSEMNFKVRIVKQENFDIIYCFASHRPANYFPSIAAKKRGATLFDEWWEWFGTEGIAKYRKGLMGRAVGLYDSIFELRFKKPFDGIVCITSLLKKRISEVYPDKATLVATGAVDAGNLKVVSRDIARSALNINPDDFIVGIVNLCPEDFEDNRPFLESLNDLVNIMPDLKVFCTGKKDYVPDLIRKFIEPSRIIYPGWVSYDEYNLYLASCDVFVLPYPDIIRNAARWPNKIGDFIATKRPIISNPTGDVKNLFNKHPDLGILCPNDKDSYKQALEAFSKSQSRYDLASVNLEELSTRNRMESIFNFMSTVARKSLKI